MGREIRCFAEVGDWTGEGRLLLETDALIFRGARKLTVPRTSITRAYDDNGWLVIEHGDARDRFDLGRLAPAWVNAIVHPRSRIDKLDVRETSSVATLGELDEDFLTELRDRAASVDGGAAPVDLMFVRVASLADLERLPALRERIRQDGAIWIIHPKGHAELKHEPIVAAAKGAGLIDNKSARFSETHSALKLVIPRRSRG